MNTFESYDFLASKSKQNPKTSWLLTVPSRAVFTFLLFIISEEFTIAVLDVGDLKGNEIDADPTPRVSK